MGAPDTIASIVRTVLNGREQQLQPALNRRVQLYSRRVREDHDYILHRFHHIFFRENMHASFNRPCPRTFSVWVLHTPTRNDLLQALLQQRSVGLSEHESEMASAWTDTWILGEATPSKTNHPIVMIKTTPCGNGPPPVISQHNPPGIIKAI